MAPVLAVWFCLAASTPEDQARATALLKSLQEEQAITVLSRALDREDATPAVRAELYMLLGVARFNLNDDEGARLAFRKALDADPAATLPKLAPPRARPLVLEEMQAAEKRREDAKTQQEKAEAPPVVTPPVVTPPVAMPPVVTPPVVPAEAHAWLDTRRTVFVCTAVAGALAAVAGAALVGRSSAAYGDAMADPNALSAMATFNDAQSLLHAGWGLVFAGLGVALISVVLGLIPFQ